MAKRYNCTHDASLEFQIETKLYQARQEPGQSIADFYSQTNSLWEQFSAANPQLKYPKDVEIFAKCQGRRKFMHFMMALRADLESTRASLLHRTPLPILEVAVTELMSKETRRSTMHLQSLDMFVTAAPQANFLLDDPYHNRPSRS